MPLLHTNGTTLFYEIHGSGTPLVFVHSHGFSHEMFFPQVHYFCKRGYTVILVDLRGNGQSGKLNAPVEDIVMLQSQDLKMLLDHLDLPSATFVGVADGGVLVQQFAMLFPDRVSAIVLVDSHSKQAASGWGGKLLAAMKAATWLTYYLPAVLFLRGLKVTYYRWDVAYAFLRSGMMRKRPTEWIKQRLAIGRIRNGGQLSAIQAPVLCVTGDFSPEAIRQMRQTFDLLPHAEFALIEDAFVPSNLCQPRPFNDTVMQFLETPRTRQYPNISIDS